MFICKQPFLRNIYLQKQCTEKTYHLLLGLLLDWGLGKLLIGPNDNIEETPILFKLAATFLFVADMIGNANVVSVEAPAGSGI